MTTTRQLRSVQPDEKPPAKRRPRAKTISQAVKDGDERALLVAMATRLAKAVEDPNCPKRDLASLTKRLREVTNDLADFDARAAEEGEGVAATTPDEQWEAI